MKQIQNTANGVIKRKAVTLIYFKATFYSKIISNLSLYAAQMYLKYLPFCETQRHSDVENYWCNDVGENISCNALVFESKPSYHGSCLTGSNCRSLMTTVILQGSKECGNSM